MYMPRLYDDRCGAILCQGIGTRGCTVSESAVMDRPKAKRKKATAKKPVGAKPTALTIRGSLDWRDWLERGADHCRTDVAKLVDASVIEYLRARGFEETPPRR
jgi:hypothetical protein